MEENPLCPLVILRIGSINLPVPIVGKTKSLYLFLKTFNIFFGGTFSGNSIATYVGKLTTEYIFKNKMKIFSKLDKKADYFQKELNNFIKKKAINAHVYRFQSLIRLVFSDKEISNRLQRDFLEKKNNRNIKKLRSFLLKKHIYYPTSGIIFISTETSFSDLKKILREIKEGLAKYII